MGVLRDKVGLASELGFPVLLGFMEIKWRLRMFANDSRILEEFKEIFMKISEFS
jgi:hypothetical protein